MGSVLLIIISLGCGLPPIGARPLPDPMRTYCQLGTQDNTLVTSESRYDHHERNHYIQVQSVEDIFFPPDLNRTQPKLLKIMEESLSLILGDLWYHPFT